MSLPADFIKSKINLINKKLSEIDNEIVEYNKRLYYIDKDGYNKNQIRFNTLVLLQNRNSYEETELIRLAKELLRGPFIVTKLVTLLIDHHPIYKKNELIREKNELLDLLS